MVKEWPTRSLEPQNRNPIWLNLDVVHDALARVDRGSPFLRTWYLFWDSFRQAHINYQWQGWPRYSKQAVEMFPDDAEILLSAGARSELDWWTSHNERRDLGQIRNPLSEVADLLLNDARGLLQRSFTLNPKESETRLRLAHVLLELDKRDDAMKLLSGHVWAPDEAAFEYLGRLFEGDLQAKRGNVTAALASYDRAIALVPVAQSARLAKAQLLYAQGRRPDAAAISSEVMTDDKPQLDPWWLFITGRGWRMPAYLKLARAMVMQ
jgi:tetratricopeptide (TPR) repeat protein